MMVGSHGPSGAFTIYRPPWEGFFKPPAMRVVADLQQEIFLVGFGVRAFGRVPLELLGGGRSFLTIQTLVAFGTDSDPHSHTQDRQVSEHYRIIESVKLGNPSTTLPTLRPLNPTRYSNNVVATIVDLYIQHRDIRYIQQDCDLRFDRFALLLLSVSILSHLGKSPITTTYWGLHGNYQRTRFC